MLVGGGHFGYGDAGQGAEGGVAGVAEMIAGAYRGVDSLRSAQRGGLYLVFAHDLDNFVAWLRSA